MDKDLIHEIEWRKLLAKRLKSARTVLKRDSSAEDKRHAEAKQLAAGYANFDEAHEAYGWGDISEKQLYSIKAIFENRDNNPSKEALKQLSHIIGLIEGEIKMLMADDDYRAEIIITEESS